MAKAGVLREALDEMALMKDVGGCALVEIDAGMVWHAAGHMPRVQQVAEAASDYWRLYRRLSSFFDELGELRASALLHEHGRITLAPCGKGMLLVMMTRDGLELDWSEWHLRSQALAAMVDDL